LKASCQQADNDVVNEECHKSKMSQPLVEKGSRMFLAVAIIGFAIAVQIDLIPILNEEMRQEK